MKPFRFLQISDLHIDSRLSHSQIGLPEAKRLARIKEINNLIVDACRLAEEASVEAILIPGDLWDDESVSAESVNMLVETFSKSEDIPIFIAPGNHDFYSLSSLYNAETQKARAMRPWPNNVFIFTASNFESLLHPIRSDVSFVGRAFRENVTLNDRLLKTRLERPKTKISILLFHGSLDTYIREGRDKITAPFSNEELVSQHFSYTALGHYHHFTEIGGPNNRIVGAYAGCTAGRTLTETGPHYVLIGELDQAGLTGALEKIQLDGRILHSLEVDLTEATSDQMVERVADAVRMANCKRSDIVCLRLTGRLPYGANVAGIDAHFGDQYFHLKIFDSTVPNYNLETYDGRTIEGRFIQEIKRRMALSTAEDEQKQLESALFYGLDALIQKQVRPRHED